MSFSTEARRERSGALTRLNAAVPDLWSDLGPLCVTCDRAEAERIGERLHTYLADDERHADHAGELGRELLALLAGWEHFDAEQRAALVGTMSYVLSSDDAHPDTEAGGLDDDDRAVSACVRVLLRPAA